MESRGRRKLYGSTMFLKSGKGGGKQEEMNISTLEQEVDISQIAVTLWRGKLFIFLISVICIALGAVYAYQVSTPVYTASSVVTLESREQPILDANSVVSGLSGDQASINTEVEVLRSRVLIERLVHDLNLLDDSEFNVHLKNEGLLTLGSLKGYFFGGNRVRYTSDKDVLDAAVNAVLERLQVSNVRQSYVFRITFTTEKPEKSARLANGLAELYIEDQIRVKSEKTQQATAWLSGRVAELKEALERAEEEVKEFKSRANLFSPDVLNARNLQIKELRERRDALEGDRILIKQQLETLEAALAARRLQDFANAAQDDVIRDAVRRGDALDVVLTRGNEIISSLKSDLEVSDGQLKSISNSITNMSFQVERQGSELVELQQLEREAEASRLIYEAFLSRLKEASIQQGIHQADSRILSMAVVPRSASAPHKALILALSLMVGFTGSAFFVIFNEARSESHIYRSADELEADTGCVVLGRVPIIPARKRSQIVNYLREKPASAAAEAIRDIRTSIVLSSLDSSPKVIMSTSSAPGEGKTTNSIALAHNFSDLGERVILIEGDIRRRVFHEYFGFKERTGFTSVLSGERILEDVIFADGGPGFDVLLGGDSKINAADLFSSRKFSELMDALRDKYDRIIVDTPPVLAVPDARVVGKLVDATLYSVKWDSTSRRQVSEGLRSLETVGVHVLGLVLTQVDPKGMKRYGYGDDYSEYGGYYKN